MVNRYMCCKTITRVIIALDYLFIHYIKSVIFQTPNWVLESEIILYVQIPQNGIFLSPIWMSYHLLPKRTFFPWGGRTESYVL